MCGIVGIVHRAGGPPVAPAVVKTMCDAIVHRGPNDEGMMVTEGVGLGMRRLSIIDLSGGHQPVFNEDGRVAIVFNGEIYNYRELRQGLIARGHVMRTHSDTETIVHLYEERGAACLDQLRGMFALAIWDEGRRELLLARDRFGMKPLYVTRGTWGLAFASELKALHAVGLAGEGLDWEALASVFHVGYVPAPRTPFQGVTKLEPGHYLRWSPDGSTAMVKYWDLPTAPSGSPREAEEEVRELLDESVAAHLESDVPVAAFLSGGIDSSAIVSSMATIGRMCEVFTARYRGSGAASTDESVLARALADRYGLSLRVVDVEPDVQSIIEPIVYALDEPHADESAIPTWVLCEQVAREYRVALVGTGGDELFAGYRRHFALRAAGAWQAVPATVRRAVSWAANRLPEPRSGGLTTWRVKRFLRSSGDTLPARYHGLQDKLAGGSPFSPAVAQSDSAAYSVRSFERHGGGARRSGALTSALYLDYKTYLPDDLLHVADRISMAHSLELRTPFVDHRIVERLFLVPDHVRVGLTQPKRLLRRAMRPRLPAGHFRAPKRGFIGPTASWLRHELAELLADELSAERMRRLGYFVPEVVDRMRTEHAERRQNHEGALWALLCFSIWHRRFIESPIHRLKYASESTG